MQRAKKAAHASALAALCDPRDQVAGQQGDSGDAHADMMPAPPGSLLTWPFLRIRAR